MRPAAAQWREQVARYHGIHSPLCKRGVGGRAKARRLCGRCAMVTIENPPRSLQDARPTAFGRRSAGAPRAARNPCFTPFCKGGSEILLPFLKGGWEGFSVAEQIPYCPLASLSPSVLAGRAARCIGPPSRRRAACRSKPLLDPFLQRGKCKTSSALHALTLRNSKISSRSTKFKPDSNADTTSRTLQSHLPPAWPV